MKYPTNATWSVDWNGETISAPSAFDLLATIGETSYVPSDAKYPKRGISFRVWTQFGILIDPDLADELFLIALAEFGILTLTIKGEVPSDFLQEAADFSQSFHHEGF